MTFSRDGKGGAQVSPSSVALQGCGVPLLHRRRTELHAFPTRWSPPPARRVCPPELSTSCDKRNFDKLFLLPPLERKIPNTRAKNTAALSFSLRLPPSRSLVYSSTPVSSRGGGRALRIGVSVATGMRLISKVRLREQPRGVPPEAWLRSLRFADLC